jgi:hypothetical protein
MSKNADKDRKSMSKRRNGRKLAFVIGKASFVPQVSGAK